MKVWSLLATLLFVFSSSSQMILDGTATGGCDCYTLTTTTSQAGSIWSPATIDLSLSFDFTFKINLGFSDGGADGIVFVLRQSGTSTGDLGSLLGYGGISPSVGVEVDTWNSSPVVVSGDIPSDHVGMNVNGTVNHDLVPAIAIANIEDGIFHDFRVTWNPVLTQLQVFLDGVSLFVHTEDLVTTVFGGDPNVYFGWTGATGGASNIQQVCFNTPPEIEVDYLLACPGQELNFSFTSGGGLFYDGVEFDSYLWEFEGGGTSDLENPTHSFATIGMKDVTLTVTNLIGCEMEVEITVTVNTISIEVESTPLTCFGSDDGTATATPDTGVPPFTFLWDDPLAQTTVVATGLSPGFYTVTVTDDRGCEQTGTVEVTEPFELLPDVITVVNATCGLNDGELTLTALGGITPYEFSIDDGVTFTGDFVFTDLPDGTINYQIMDDNGCVYSGAIDIESNDLVIEMTDIDVTCNGFDNGLGTAAPEFGVGPCSNAWDDPLAQTTPTATNLAPGIYNVTVTHDAIGCSGTGTITITEPLELLIYETTFVNASCGVNNGEIAIEVTGGTVPYEYSIDGGITFQPLATFSGLAPGDYEILVKDAKDCTVEDFITLVNVSNVPEIIITSDYYEGCKPLKVNMVNESDPTLTANTYWELGDGSTFEGELLSHTYLNAGCYDLHITITTFDGCITEATFNDFICVWELPIAAFEFTPSDPDMLHSKVDFINESEFASTYEWDFGDGTTGSEFEPSHAYPPLGNIDYNVQLTAITDKGCTDITSKIVIIDEVVQYYIPNTFTPDADSYNATFRPYFMTGFYPQDFHFVIYNRYGEVLWESYDPNAGWDGTYAGTLVQDGVYIWNLTFKENQTDKKREDFGHITVLK